MNAGFPESEVARYGFGKTEKLRMFSVFSNKFSSIINDNL